MPLSLNEIKILKTVDLDVFSIRGAKTGIGNARSTGPLYVDGTFVNPVNSLLYGSVTTSGSDTTVTGIAVSGMTAMDLVAGDTIVAGPDSLTVSQPLTTTSVVVTSQPSSSATYLDATYSLKDRDYLIEPDVNSNTIYKGLAKFTYGSNQIEGSGTTWMADLTSGDAIQLNTYQKYFIIDQRVSDTSCTLTSAFDDPTNPTGFNPYTAKKWRLGRLAYQYVKNNFSYDNISGHWVYDSTTGGDRTAYPYYSPLDGTSGIDLKFSPTLKPTKYPDLMDSNVALLKTLARSTVNDAFQFPLPAVPRPEESFTLYLNDMPKVNGVDYVINYSQMPNYVLPPPPDQRTVANLMFLKGIQDATLSVASTQTGVLAFTDNSGNSLQGIMPGTEVIKINGVDQTANKDFVLDLNSGLGYASEVITDEPVVKYVLYPQADLYDLGLNILLNNVPQKLTIPGDPSDDVMFDTESGRLKPQGQDNPGPGEEYLVQYYSEGEYVSDEMAKILSPTNWVRVNAYPIKYQSVILAKNGVYLDEGIDFRVSYLTGRIVFFSPLVVGDLLDISYSPLIRHENGLTYENGENYTKVYDAKTTVAALNPLSFVFPNSALVTNENLVVQGIFNQTKGLPYDTTGYTINGYNVIVVSNTQNLSVGTSTSDVIQITYKFPNDGVESIPVQTINFSVNEGTNYMALVNQNRTGMFLPGMFVRLTNVDTAGNFFFKIVSVVYDGEDTVVYFTGNSPSDIVNPLIYISDTDTVTFNSVPLTASPIMSGSVDLQFPGTNMSRDFRIGQLLNIGTDFYYIIGSDYTNSTNIVSINVPSFQDYTDSFVLNSIYKSDYPIYYQNDVSVGTMDSVITEPAVPVMTLNYDGYAVVTKDSSALSVDVGASHYTFLDTSYPSALTLQLALDTTVGIDATLYSNDWSTSNLDLFTGLTVTENSNSLITGHASLRLNGMDTTSFSVLGNTLIVNPLVPGQRYNFDYLGQRFLDDSTVVFSGSYFTTLPAKTKVSVSMKYDNLDQFYIQVMSQRSFLEYVIEPKRQEEAAQQSGNVGQGGDLPGDEGGGNSTGGLTNLEYSRMDEVIECTVFDKIFDFFNGRLQAYSAEMFAMRGWNLLNNDGILSETDQSSGALPVNRMFPWTNYTDFPPYKIACLTGQAVPYAVPGTKKPNKKSPCKAIFSGTNVTCITAPYGFPSYWTYQLRVNDYIRPYDTTTNYKITSILNNSQLTITPPYTGLPIPKPFVMTSNFPLYDDDGYTGPKVIGTESEDFGLVDNDVFDIQVDGSNQSYTFHDPTDPLIKLLFPLSGLSAPDVAKLLSTALDINVSVGWYFDPNSVYGYSTGLIARADGTHNKLIIKHGSAVSKLGFDVDTTTFGNNDSSYSNPEILILPLEPPYLSTELVDLNTLLSYSNKMDRTTNIGLAYSVQSACTSEVPIIADEIIKLGDETSALKVLISEPSMATANMAAYGDATAFLNDSTTALAYAQAIANNYQGTYDPYVWAFDILPGFQSIPVLPSDASFVLPVFQGPYDRRVVDATINGTPYVPVVSYIYGMDSTVLDGTWSGYDPLSSNHYSDPSQDFVFHRKDDVLFLTHYFDGSSYAYYVDSSGLAIKRDATYHYYNYTSYLTVASIKSAINADLGSPNFFASGNPSFDSYPPGFAIIGSSGSPIPLTVPNTFKIYPDFSLILPSLSTCNVTYYTIDNQFLMDRISFDTTRMANILNRESFITSRENQIKSNILQEELFMSSDASNIGNLYEWADNRFNRSVGCEARLKQIEKQIQMNNSGLTVSRRFF